MMKHLCSVVARVGDFHSGPVLTSCKVLSVYWTFPRDGLFYQKTPYFGTVVTD